jgi:integrase
MRWMIDLRTLGGGREFFKSERAAAKRLSEALFEFQQDGRLAFELPHETKRRYLAMDRRLAELGATIEQAVDHFEKTHRGRNRKKFGEAVKLCLDAKRAAGRRERATLQLEYSLNSLVKSVGAESYVDTIELSHIEAWLSNPKWSLETRKHKLIDAGTFFSFAVKRGWCVASPAAQHEPISVDSKPPVPLTVDQVKRLLSAVVSNRPQFLPFVALGIFCGIRPDELKSLSWAEVDLDHGWVRIPAHIAKRTKRGNRRERLIELQPNALAWMKRAKELAGQLPPLSWQDDWDAVRKAAGFAVSVRTKRGQRERSDGELWNAGAMRDSFCSYCLAKFDERDESRWAGHSPDVAVAKYRAVVTPQAAEQFWRIWP